METDFSTLVIMSAAGGAGCAARALVRDMLIRLHIEAWTVTVAVNIVGSAVMGLLMARADGVGLWPCAAGIGFLGGWTTYSAFSVDVVLLWMRGRRTAAACCWIATIGLAPLAAFGGFRLLQCLAQSGGAA